MEKSFVIMIGVVKIFFVNSSELLEFLEKLKIKTIFKNPSKQYFS